MATPTAVPAQLTAGDSWEWTVTYADYPATTWTGTWYFIGTASSFTVAGSPSGTDHAGTKTASLTADIEPGLYQWQFRVTDGSSVYTIEKGATEVLADPAYIKAVDARTFAQRTLEAIEAYLSDSGNLTAASYSLGGRSLSRWSRSELLAERERWLAEVRSEEAVKGMAQGLGNPRRLYVRFDRA